MKISVTGVISTAVFGLFLGGCVASGTYQAKEQESQQLRRTLEETKSSCTELKAKYGKLEEAQSGQSTNLQRITADCAALKLEHEKLVAANSELSEKLQKTSTLYVEVKLENARLSLENKNNAEQMKKIAAESAELKWKNAKLVEAAKPENMLKTLSGIFTADQQKIKELKAENVKMKTDLFAAQKLQSAVPAAGKETVSGNALPVTPAIKSVNKKAAEPLGMAPAVK